MTISAPRATNWNARGLLFPNKFFIQMFEVRQMILFFLNCALKEKRLGTTGLNDCSARRTCACYTHLPRAQTTFFLRQRFSSGTVQRLSASPS